ncbi:phage tail tape measure protein [Pseudomonas sp. SLFW]|uniref:phage tail tape measure protein n=1 Tax=Pseudomonas sp. SLFW TaxID=2683259 RepID=UPI001411F134|nr:phage tail tape measure protein [Pseudomonas sp. SLFW]NBB09347.1 phage tail tape measure protein [Pseudomonas sp. SLFW]
MANELLIGLTIGATVAASFHAALGIARSNVTRLERATEGLIAKQTLMGSRLSEALAQGGSGVERLRGQYDRVGHSVDQLKRKQVLLNASIIHGARAQRLRQLQGVEGSGAIRTGAVLGIPLAQAFRSAVDFRDQTRDISITAALTPAQELHLGGVLRDAALSGNQPHAEVAKGTAVLAESGISDPKELAGWAPVMAKAATATRQDIDTVSQTLLGLKKGFGVDALGAERAISMLIASSKSGDFKLPSMKAWLPVLGQSLSTMGISGERAVAETGAALQIARRGASSDDEAGTNFQSFLSALADPGTLKQFERAGIDLKSSMQDLIGTGLSPAQSMVQLLTLHLGTHAPEAAEQYRQALGINDEQARDSALARLDETYKLGELFADQKALGFVRPALAYGQDLGALQRGNVDAANAGVLDQDWNKRMGSPKEQFSVLRNSLTDLGISVGDALLPVAIKLTQTLIPLVQTVSEWSAANPTVVAGIIGIATGFIFWTGACALLLPLFNALGGAFSVIGAQWTYLKAMWQMGKFTPFISGLTRAGSAALALGRTLGGGLLIGIKVAAQAILWLGRALLMNPIGLIITAIAGAAYLIYRNWEPLKAFFLGLWDEIKTGFSGGLGGIAQTILNFSPLGLFYRAFAGLMSYFGIELPSKFTEFGGMLIAGLVDGISNALLSARETVVGVGTSIKSWFTETLGIQSPSRVFIGYGTNISEGAALGIDAGTGQVHQAALNMARQTAVPLQPLNPMAVSQASVMGGAAPAGGAMVVNYSPQISLTGGEAQAQIGQALQAGYADFVRFMERFQHDQRRRSYGAID